MFNGPPELHWGGGWSRLPSPFPAAAPRGRLSLGEGPLIAGLETQLDDAVLADRSVSLRSALARYFQRRVSDPSEVEDLIQEVFLRIVRRGASGQLEQLDGYIFRTAASVLTDRARRRRTRQADRHILFEPDLHSGQTAGAETSLIETETLKAVGVALLELPERTRRVFVLRRMEGLSNPEVARRLGVSASAVEKHMLRAVRHILARTKEQS